MDMLYIAVLAVQLASGGDASWAVDFNLTAEDCEYVKLDWEVDSPGVEIECRPQWEEK